jgi:hypothetical protein
MSSEGEDSRQGNGVVTEVQTSEGFGFLGRLRNVAVTAGERVADTEVGKKLAPVLEQGKKVTSEGLKVAAHVGEQAHEIATQAKLWDEQRALVEQMLEVLTLQQGLIEDLRARVVVLEGAE